MKTRVIFLIRSIWILAFIAIGIQQVEAQEVRPYPMEEKAVLWEISGKGIPEGSHLFGTMHLIEEAYFFFPEELQSRLVQSDLLLMELSTAEEKNIGSAMSLLLLKEGKMTDFFSKEQSDTLFMWLEREVGIDSTMFAMTMNGFKPVVLVALGEQTAFGGSTKSYEKELVELADSVEIPNEGLETIADQIGVFDGLSMEQQAEMVMSAIRERDSVNSGSEMSKIYASQDVDGMYQMIQEEGASFGDQLSAFVDDRNRNWIPKIEAIIREKKVFIAVGAGHLGGPVGVIRLLEKQGYTLTPVQL